MVAQTNDTDHHLWVRKRFIELQTALMIKKARETGGGLTDLSREENLDIMIEVMSDKNLHIMASEGYKYTGTTNALDGSEDNLITREAGRFWKEQGMSKKRDAAVADVKAKFDAGLLPWNFKTVQSLIGAYPPRNTLDVVLPGQEDEATEDPEGVPWEDAAEDPEPDPGDPEDLPDDLEVPDYDPSDWLAPPQGSDEGAAEPSNHGGVSGEDKEGEGVCDDGAVAVLGESSCHGDGANLDAEGVSFMNAHLQRMQSLEETVQIFSGIDGALGASLSTTVKRVIHNEQKRFRARMNGDAEVDKAMRTIAEAEEQHSQMQRLLFQESCQLKRQQRATKVELAKAAAKLKAVRKATREAEETAAVVTAVKSYTLPMLGQGKKTEVVRNIKRRAEIS